MVGMVCIRASVIKLWKFSFCSLVLTMVVNSATNNQSNYAIAQKLVWFFIGFNKYCFKGAIIVVVYSSKSKGLYSCNCLSLRVGLIPAKPQSKSIQSKLTYTLLKLSKLVWQYFLR